MLGYKYRLMRNFTPLAKRRAGNLWVRELFGRKSCNTHRQRTRSRLVYARFEAMRVRTSVAGRTVYNRIFLRLREAYLRS